MEAERSSLTRGSSCDLGVDRPEDEADLESVFNSVSVAPGAGVKFCEEESGMGGGWDDDSLSSICSQESTGDCSSILGASGGGAVGGKGVLTSGGGL